MTRKDTMHTFSNKSQYLAIALAFTGFVVFCTGTRFGYQFVSALYQP